MRHRHSVASACALALAVSCPAPARAAEPHARLAARSVLPAATARSGSPPSGAFLSAKERATAAANGVEGPAEGPYLPAQPVQGFSSMVPAQEGTWWALADNGFAWRPNSAAPRSLWAITATTSLKPCFSTCSTAAG